MGGFGMCWVIVNGRIEGRMELLLMGGIRGVWSYNRWTDFVKYGELSRGSGFREGRKVGGKRYEALSRGRSSLDSSAF